MIDYVKQILTGQFEATLAMLKECIEKCPPEHWEGKIGNKTYRETAYHALFFVDFYLTPNEESFTLREFHQRGGDEREPIVSPGLSKAETLEYVQYCRQKMLAAIAAETQASLEGPSGVSYKKFSRGELHLDNIRGMQHHTGQLSANLRRLQVVEDPSALPWVGSGWR